MRVAGGVALTNEEMAVEAAPGKLSATVRPPVDDVFNFSVGDVQNLTPRPVVELPGNRSAAITT